MAEENLPIPGRKSFEDLKKVNRHGAEYWTARELQPLLGYRQWRSFEKAVAKAITSCEQSGNDHGHHFARARKMIELGKGGRMAWIAKPAGRCNHVRRRVARLAFARYVFSVSSSEPADAFANLTIKKIPKAVLHKCEWGHDDYSLEIKNLPAAPPLFSGRAFFW